jgi:hypothetical protein
VSCVGHLPRGVFSPRKTRKEKKSGGERAVHPGHAALTTCSASDGQKNHDGPVGRGDLAAPERAVHSVHDAANKQRQAFRRLFSAPPSVHARAKHHSHVPDDGSGSGLSGCLKQVHEAPQTPGLPPTKPIRLMSATSLSQRGSWALKQKNSCAKHHRPLI